MAKVSVIVPIYGVELYIERCATSLFNQTLDDIEYIFVDDCTKDASISILKSVIDRYPIRKQQCIIITHETNKGLPTARRTGIEHASGDYIIHCDSDDWPEIDMYKTLYDAAIENDSDIVYCDFYKTDGEGRKLYISQGLQNGLMQGPVWNKLVRRSVYEKANLVYPVKNKAEDGAYMTQLSYNSKTSFYCKFALYNYFYNPDSICRVETPESCLKRFVEEKENTDLRLRFLESKGAISQYKYDIYRWKILTKRNLVPLLNDKRYRKMWRETYSEMNFDYLLDLRVPIRRKVSFIAAYIGVYNFVKKVIGDCL